MKRAMQQFFAVSTALVIAAWSVVNAAAADGVWICKNSRGAVTSDIPHKGDWGVDGSGYFYLSYYDTRIASLESFDYDVKGTFSHDDDFIYVEQYG